MSILEMLAFGGKDEGEKITGLLKRQMDRVMLLSGSPSSESADVRIGKM